MELFGPTLRQEHRNTKSAMKRDLVRSNPVPVVSFTSNMKPTKKNIKRSHKIFASECLDMLENLENEAEMKNCMNTLAKRLQDCINTDFEILCQRIPFDFIFNIIVSSSNIELVDSAVKVFAISSSSSSFPIKSYASEENLLFLISIMQKFDPKSKFWKNIYIIFANMMTSETPEIREFFIQSNIFYEIHKHKYNIVYGMFLIKCLIVQPQMEGENVEFALSYIRNLLEQTANFTPLFEYMTKNNFFQVIGNENIVFDYIFGVFYKRANETNALALVKFAQDNRLDDNLFIEIVIYYLHEKTCLGIKEECILLAIKNRASWINIAQAELCQEFMINSSINYRMGKLCIKALFHYSSESMLIDPEFISLVVEYKSDGEIGKKCLMHLNSIIQSNILSSDNISLICSEIQDDIIELGNSGSSKISNAATQLAATIEEWIEIHLK